MSKTKEKEILTFLRVMTSYFKTPVDENIIKSYVLVLRAYDINYNKLLQDVLTNLENKPYDFPSIKQLLYLSGNGEDKTKENKATQLISDCKLLAKEIGAYDHDGFVEKSNNTQKAFIRRMGGWRKFCQADLESPSMVKLLRDNAVDLLSSDFHLSQNYKTLEKTNNPKLDTIITNLLSKEKAK